MSGNNKSLIACLLFALAASPAYAQSAAAPALFDVEEVIVQPLHFGNDNVAKSCGLSQKDLETALKKTLLDNGVPAMAPADAPPPVFNRARINLVADIYSYNSEGLDCTSWISLSAETNNAVHVPPVDVARNVNITYWREGSMLSSAQSTHEGLVNDLLQKLANRFAAQYKQAQPSAASK